jgi:hypothetical protein
MSWRHQQEAIPPIRPMYHLYPEDEQAYHVPQQYTFGSELIAAPFIAPAGADTVLSRQVVWLPEGEWFDFFSGVYFPGDQWHAVYGGRADIPVFARAGAIVPLAPRTGWGGVANPESLEVHLFPGAGNHFELYEDGGDGRGGHSLTPFTLSGDGGELRLEIGPVRGETAHLPERRRYTLLFRGLNPAAQATVERNGVEIAVEAGYDEGQTALRLPAGALEPADRLVVTLRGPAGATLLAAQDHRLVAARAILRAVPIDTNAKLHLWERLADVVADPALLAEHELALPPAVSRALVEVIAGAGFHQCQVPGRHDEVVLWNNGGSPLVTYKLLGHDRLWQRVYRHGPLPRFAVLQPAGEGVAVHTGRGLAIQYATLEQWFAALPHRFQPAEGLPPAVVQFDLRGGDGLQRAVSVEGSRLSVAEGLHERPEATIRAHSRDLLAIINGEADPGDLIFRGRVDVEGDLSMVMPLMSALGTIPRDWLHNRHWKLEVNYLDMATFSAGSGQ